MKTCVVVNPRAGGAGEIETLREALRQMRGAEVRFTERAGDGRKIARQALESGADLIVAAGGDGTLNEVVNGLAADFGRARLGLLPLGTGNDFARSIDVPADLDASLAFLAAGRARRLDVGRATLGEESRYFINMSAGGVGGIVSEKADDLKARWGPLAYLRAAIGTLPEIEGFRTRILLDDGERLEVDAYNVVVSNGRYVAAGTPVSPQSLLDDGRFDLMLVPESTLPKLALLVPQILLGRHSGSDLLEFRTAARIEIESAPPMSFNLDGEVIGEGPIRFEVLPRALTVITGPEAAVKDS